MICETCHGQRFVEVVKKEDGVLYAMVEPCPECGGQAFTHCCGGDRAQCENER